MIKMITAVTAALVLSAAPALAVTVHNRDADTRQVTFDKGVDEVVHPVEAGMSVTEPCPEGCAVRVAGRGHDFLAEDGDMLAIDDMVIGRDTGALEADSQ